ncbi:MAG: hypothetical protein M1820_001248 [Bogoriella megaspora]|nr:MAG: hypothetical protein M1820_001248 [Bogoriella megaspora]
MAPAYDIAELRRLRNSASESTIALEKEIKEDVVKGEAIYLRALLFLHNVNYIMFRYTLLVLRRFSLVDVSLQGLSELLWLIERPMRSEHVLRASSSFASRNSVRQENSRSEAPPNSRLQSNRFGNSKSSPTPSIKRGKAERLLKEHGSPPGLRVTAGGKIVPSNLSPLCSPRIGFSQPSRLSQLNIANPFEGPPGIPPAAMPGRPLIGEPGFPMSPFMGFTPDGQCVPLMPVPLAPFPPTYVPANSFPTPPVSWNPSAGQFPPQMASAPTPVVPAQRPARVASLSTNQQVQALEREQAKLSEEYRQVDQAGVIHEGVLNAVQRTSLVARKVSLTNRLDEIRVSLKKLKTSEDTKASPPPSTDNPPFGQSLPKPGRPALPVPQAPNFNSLQHNASQFGNVMPFQSQPSFYVPSAPFEPHFQEADPRQASFLMPNGAPDSVAHATGIAPSLPRPSSGAICSTSAPSPIDYNTVSQQRTVSSPVSIQPVSEPRRSHAIPIKNPRDDPGGDVKHRQTSSLDPTRFKQQYADELSPSYKPAAEDDLDTRQSNTPGHEEAEMVGSASTPCPRHLLGKDYDWPPEDDEVFKLAKSTGLQRQPSMSSVSTADFFPRNPVEHSGKNLRCREVTDPGLLAPPATPDMSSPTALTARGEQRNSEPTAVTAFSTFRTSSWNAACDPVNDRMEHNKSPKSRIPVPSSSEADAIPKRTFESSVFYQASEDRGYVLIAGPNGTLETLPRGLSDEYCEGYFAGMHRLPLKKYEKGDTLKGYIAGLQRFAELHACSTAHSSDTTDTRVGAIREDPDVNDGAIKSSSELKENAAAKPSTSTQKESLPLANSVAPLTRQMSGNQIQSLESIATADKPHSAITSIPPRLGSIGQTTMSPGGTLGEQRSRVASLPMNHVRYAADVIAAQQIPQNDGMSENEAAKTVEVKDATEGTVVSPQKELPAIPTSPQTSPQRANESPSKRLQWHPLSPKASPSKSGHSPTKSRIDRLASHLGVKKSDQTGTQDEGLGSPELGPSTMSPERKKKREELKRFLSKPKAERIPIVTPVDGQRNLDA